MPSEDYERACAIHDRITGLYPKVLVAKVYRRKHTKGHRAVFPPGHPGWVDRDLTVLALITKASTTHTAIRVLTDARLANDANSLYRTILENVILLEWLLRESYRLDLYVLSDELLVTRIAEATARHYDDRPQFKQKAAERAKASSSLVKSVFGEKLHKWAKKLSPDLSGLEGDVSVADIFN